MKHSKPEDLFRAEKERSLAVRDSQHARLLAEAKAAFDKLMAEGQAARKSGRPRKHPLPPLKTTSSRTPPRPLPVQSMTPVPAPVVAAPPAPTPATKPAKPAKPAKTKPAAKRANKLAAPQARAKAKGKSSKKR